MPQKTTFIYYPCEKCGLDRLIGAQEAATLRIEALRGAIERPVPGAPEIEVGVEPLRREAELIRRRIQQLHERLLQSDVRLSGPGRVTRIIHRPGEFVKVGDPVLVVSWLSTVRVVAYFDQATIPRLRLNGEVRIESSYAPEVRGRIARLGPSLIIGPEAIARHYPDGQPLFPVRIELDEVTMKHLAPGSVVRVFPCGTRSTARTALAR